MPIRGRTSALYPGPRSDLESHGFAPEFVPTAAEQRLMLFTHIVRAFGITIALMINAVVFVPFFVFGILPALIRKRFGTAPVYPPLAAAGPNGETERSQGIFFSRDHHHRHPKTPDGDVSPLLLSADTSVSDFAPYRERPATLHDIQENFPRLPTPMTDCPSLVGGYGMHDGPTLRVTQPQLSNRSSMTNGSSYGSVRSDDGIDDGAEDEEDLVMMRKTMAMAHTKPVGLLIGAPKFGCGHTSGLSVPGRGHSTGMGTGTGTGTGTGVSMVIKREKTWENLQEAVYPNSTPL